MMMKALLLLVFMSIGVSGCSWNGLPYSIDICDLFHHNKTLESDPSGNCGIIKANTVQKEVFSWRVARDNCLALEVMPIVFFFFSFAIITIPLNTKVKPSLLSTPLPTHILSNYTDMMHDLLQRRDTSSSPSIPELLAATDPKALEKSLGNIPSGLECAGCIVAGTFGTLAAANFGAADAACTLCSCKKMSESQCENTIKDGLYATIASMPALAYSVFTECKPLCVTAH